MGMMQTGRDTHSIQDKNMKKKIILEGHEEIFSFESMTGKGENSEIVKSVN